MPLSYLAIQLQIQILWTKVRALQAQLSATEQAQVSQPIIVAPAVTLQGVVATPIATETQQQFQESQALTEKCNLARSWAATNPNSENPYANPACPY